MMYQSSTSLSIDWSLTGISEINSSFDNLVFLTTSMPFDRKMSTHLSSTSSLMSTFCRFKNDIVNANKSNRNARPRTPTARQQMTATELFLKDSAQSHVSAKHHSFITSSHSRFSTEVVVYQSSACVRAMCVCVPPNDVCVCARMRICVNVCRWA